MDILYLIDRLENLVTNSKRMPLVNQVILKEADLLNIIEQLRTSIPAEIKQARRIMQEKERILSQAQSDANTILNQAHAEAERALIHEGLLQVAKEREQEILRQANEQAQMIVRRAERHTEQMQIEADNYAAETLRNLKEHLRQVEATIEHVVMNEIERTVTSIDLGLESLEGRPPDEEVLPEEDDIPLDESDEDGDDSVGREQRSSSLQQRSLPRRASLAADTMGGPNFPAP
jgi:hypothetical protein